jgi:hypothetical protein
MNTGKNYLLLIEITKMTFHQNEANHNLNKIKKSYEGI